MKNVREKLISLLGLCSEDETEANKLQLLTSITQAADYLTLSKSIALKKPFEDLYAISVLEGLSHEDLKQRESLLHKLVSFNSQLIKCIHSGNGPSMSSADKPDFISIKSITKLCNSIKLSPDKTNYTNIAEENALAIFEDSTIKSAQDCFDMLPITITKSNVIDEDTLKQYMGNRLFCVNIEEFNKCHQNFLGLASRSEAIIEGEKLRKRKHRLLKFAVVMLCFGAIFACSQFGLLSSSFVPVLSAVMLIVAILFMIWG